ncbi:MAG: response regulator [Thermodesulfobacteriota bacterium]
MPKTILLIDDDADTRIYMGTILRRGGYQVLTAADGQEGWQKIQKNRPDLVLLDIMMPRRSGMNLLAELKGHPEFRHIPVFVITGVGQMTGVDLQKYMVGQPGGESVRPEAFLEKPIKPDKLLKTVKEFLPD